MVSFILFIVALCFLVDHCDHKVKLRKLRAENEDLKNQLLAYQESFGDGVVGSPKE